MVATSLLCRRNRPKRPNRPKGLRDGSRRLLLSPGMGQLADEAAELARRTGPQVDWPASLRVACHPREPSDETFFL